MPKLTRKLPSYRLHKASGQAVLTLNGKDMYLGLHGSTESKAAYDRIIAEWLANCRQHAVIPPLGVAPENAISDLSVNELFAAYWRFATSYYVKNGQPTGEVENIRDAARPLTLLYGQCMASKFGPLALEAVREAMIKQGLCRNVINARVNRIRRMFKWGVSKQMVPPLVLQSLQSLAPLKKGRCNVREAAPVKPVAEENVKAILTHVSPQVTAMIQLQMLTGMRPGEVVIMRGCDITHSGKLWTYIPSSHKTEHHDRKRIIHIGPQAQKILETWMAHDLQAYLFSPAEAEKYRRKQQHAQRRKLLSCGNCPDRYHRKRLIKMPAERYTTTSYARAIADACDKRFPPPRHLSRIRMPARGRKARSTRWETVTEWRSRIGDQKWAELKSWQHEHRWSPNQLRHNAATYLRKQFGIEAARVILGHSSAAVTEIYAELDYAKAADIMAQVG
jgi:integrase